MIETGLEVRPKTEKFHFGFIKHKIDFHLNVIRLVDVGVKRANPGRTDQKCEKSDEQIPFKCFRCTMSLNGHHGRMKTQGKHHQSEGKKTGKNSN